MKKYFPGIVLFTIVFFGLSCTYAQDKKTTQIDSLIDRAYQLGLFNGNVLVADQGNVIYKASMGFAEATRKNRLTDEYRFLIGPLLNEFSSVALMMLMEEGKLNMDDKLTKYLSGLPGWAEKISIKNLLHYNSGLPAIGPAIMKADTGRLNHLQKIDKLDFEPGSKWMYSDNNIYLQQLILEKISGMQFSQFINERIFKPCKMTSSVIDPKTSDFFIARSYDNARLRDDLKNSRKGAGYLTMDDLYTWEQCLQSFRLINPGSVSQLLATEEKGKPTALGYGVIDGKKWISHTDEGSVFNYDILLKSDMEKGRTIVLMSNNKNIKLTELSTTIQSILDGKPFTLPKKSVFLKIENQLNALNGQQIIAFYEYLKLKNGQDYDFDSEAELENIGTYLMNKNRLEDAILVFRHNTKLFPKSGHAFFNLAEALYKKNDLKDALLNYKTSLHLDPSNKLCKQMILKLEKK